MVKEEPVFLGFQFPAFGMRQWKLFEGLDKSPILKGLLGTGKMTLLLRTFPRLRNWRLSGARLSQSQKSPVVTEKQGGERKLLRADPAHPSTFPITAPPLPHFCSVPFQRFSAPTVFPGEMRKM